MHSRAATGRHGKTPDFHLLGMPRVHLRHTSGTTHPPLAVVFLVSFAPNKDVAANVGAPFGPSVAHNNNSTAMRWTTRMPETSVLTANPGNAGGS